jgi:putative transposase
MGFSGQGFSGQGFSGQGQSIELHSLAVMGYCLMSNHVHLITIPGKVDILERALKDTHGRYASYWNAVHRSSGHVW